MIDERIPLCKGDKVILSDENNHLYEWEILEEIARGSSIIAYHANHEKLGKVILKEYYPLLDEMTREGSRILCEDEENWIEMKNDFVKNTKSFLDAIKSNLMETNVYNNLPMTFIYANETSSNNTIYMIQNYTYGCIYSNHIEKNIQELIENIQSLMKITKDFHEHNYILFDIKPSNLFMVKASDINYFNFIDFDSITDKDNIFEKEIKSTHQYKDPNIDFNNINEKYDIYSLGCILKERLNHFDLNKIHPKAKDCIHELLENMCCIQEKRYNDQQVLSKLNQILEILSLKYFLQTTKLEKQVFIGYENELNEIHELFLKQNIVTICGPSGIGKKTLAYEYAYLNQNNYKNIQIIPFVNNWFESFKYFKCNQPLEINDNINFMISLLNQCDDCLLVIQDYISNSENNKILRLIRNTSCKILITSNSSKGNLELYGLNPNDAYQLFEMNYKHEIKKGDIKYIEQVLYDFGYHPSLIQLIAHGASQINASFMKSPIKLFMKDIYPEVIIYDDELYSFQEHIKNILKCKVLSEGEKEVLYLCSFADRNGLIEDFVLDYGCRKHDILSLENKMIVTRNHGRIKINNIYSKETILKVFNIDSFVQDKLFNGLSNVSYPDYCLSIITKISMVDKKLNECILNFITEKNLKEANIQLVRNVKERLDELKDYLSNQTLQHLSKFDFENIILIKENKYNEIVTKIEKSVNDQNTNILQVEKANTLRVQAKQLGQQGKLLEAVECYLKADKILENTPLGYLDIIEDCFMLCEYLTPFNAKEHIHFYAKKAFNLLKAQKQHLTKKQLYQFYLDLGGCYLHIDSFAGYTLACYENALKYASTPKEKIHCLSLMNQVFGNHSLANRSYYGNVALEYDYMHDIALKFANTIEKIAMTHHHQDYLSSLINYVSLQLFAGNVVQASALMEKIIEKITKEKISLSHSEVIMLLEHLMQTIMFDVDFNIRKEDLISLIEQAIQIIYNHTLSSKSWFSYLPELALGECCLYAIYLYPELKQKYIIIAQQTLSLVKNVFNNIDNKRICDFLDSINYNLQHIGVDYYRLPLPKVHPQEEMGEEEITFAKKYNDFLNEIQREFV